MSRDPLAPGVDVPPSSRALFGMRWWLALAFAGVAGLTAVAVVAVLSNRSENAFRTYAQEFAVGNTVAATEALKRTGSIEELRRETTEIAERRRLAIFVFDNNRGPITPPRSQGINWSAVPGGREALRTSLTGHRYISGAKDGSSFVVGLQLHGGPGGAVVAYSLRPELREQLGIVRHEFLQSALLAFAVGAALGLLIASLIARRLARIANAGSRSARATSASIPTTASPTRSAASRGRSSACAASCRSSSTRSSTTATGSSVCSSGSTRACCSSTATCASSTRTAVRATCSA